MESASKNYLRSQLHIGWMYECGKGFEKSYEDAVKWYELAAKQGNTGAINNLARLYEDGRFFDQSIEKAVQSYKDSVNDILSRLSLFRLVKDYPELFKQEEIQNYMIDSNDIEFKEWLSKKEFCNCFDEQFVMAWLYEYANIVNKDFEKARFYHEQSLNNGCEPVGERLKN